MEISEFLVAFLSQDSDTARTSGLAECARAVSKTNLGRRLLMLTCDSFLQTIQPNQHEVYGEEGGNVQLSCNCSSAYSVLWYKQYPGSVPQYLLLIHHASRTHDKKAKRVDLEISSAEVTDSALYYCALMAIVTGNPETLETIPPPHSPQWREREMQYH
uniref:Ig-like domain-containing protein n=1 Tax=Oncorhynchus tshawytscha TaxID=74940 RepID=A0A8C8J467_ONCTS